MLSLLGRLRPSWGEFLHIGDFLPICLYIQLPEVKMYLSMVLHSFCGFGFHLLFSFILDTQNNLTFSV